MLNTNLVGAMSGQGRAVAGAGANAIVMPAIKIVKGDTVTVELSNSGLGTDGASSIYVDNTAKVVGMGNNGAMSTTVYTSGTTADATHFAVSGGTLTLPVGANEDQFVITYQRTVTSGYAVVNRSDKYPQTVRLLLKVLYVDPCTAD